MVWRIVWEGLKIILIRLIHDRMDNRKRLLMKGEMVNSLLKMMLIWHVVSNVLHITAKEWVAMQGMQITAKKHEEMIPSERSNFLFQNLMENIIMKHILIGSCKLSKSSVVITTQKTDKYVHAATSEFVDYASIWWSQIHQRNRVPHTWNELKRLMRARFVPTYFERDLLNKMQRLNQGNKLVEDYYQELQVGMIRASVHEGDNEKMARFLGGLNREIQDILDF
jgi:hypothetical protein